MKTLTLKQLRTISFALERLFNPKSLLVPRSLKDYRIQHPLVRELRLRDRRTLLLTDTGLDHFRSIVSTVDAADAFLGLAAYADIWSACRKIVEECLSDGKQPEDANEFVRLLQATVEDEIHTHTFVVSIYGVELKDIDEIPLGAFRLVRPSIEFIQAAGVNFEHENLPRVIEAMGKYLWLLGSTRGTARVAQVKFRAQAELIAGLLAISAASMYEGGATAFRIGVIMAPEEAYGKSIWMSWTDADRMLTTTSRFSKSQRFCVDADLLSEMQNATVFARAFTIVASPSSPLEEAITKAVYWYSDAHRDPVAVMRLVKYWSCVEAFFSADTKDVTRSVATGLACLVAYGHYQFVSEHDYVSAKKRFAKLYDHRSRALHGASHQHVSERDAADLSQWVAWMLINMIALVERGYTTPTQVRSTVKQMDATVD